MYSLNAQRPPTAISWETSAWISLSSPINSKENLIDFSSSSTLPHCFCFYLSLSPPPSPSLSLRCNSVKHRSGVSQCCVCHRGNNLPLKHCCNNPPSVSETDEPYQLECVMNVTLTTWCVFVCGQVMWHRGGVYKIIVFSQWTTIVNRTKYIHINISHIEI